MNIAATNIPVINNPAPVALAATRAEATAVAPGRDVGENLALTESASLKHAQSFTTLRRFGDSTKSITSKLLKVAAFIGATISVGVTFFLNLKSVGLLFAIPTAMAFYIAHDLQKSLQETDPKFLTDPLRDLKAINHEPQKLETNATEVMYVIEDAKKVKVDKPEYPAIQLELSKFKHLVEVQSRQYQGAEDERSLGLSQQMQSYLEALEGVQASQPLAT